MISKILRMTASWCGPCKQLAKTLETADLGFPIEVVDIDVYPEVAQEHNVRSVPTLIALDENGKTIGTLIGLKSTDQIRDWIVAI